jgi:hypothetical protein
MRWPLLPKRLRMPLLRRSRFVQYVSSSSHLAPAPLIPLQMLRTWLSYARQGQAIRPDLVRICGQNGALCVLLPQTCVPVQPQQQVPSAPKDEARYPVSRPAAPGGSAAAPAARAPAAAAAPAKEAPEELPNGIIVKKIPDGAIPTFSD